MKANKFISKREYKFLLTTVFIAFILAFSGFVSFHIDNYNKEVEIQQFDLNLIANHGATFAVDAGPDYRPIYCFWFLFFTFFNFLSLLNARKYFVSTFSAFFSLVIFIYWIVKVNRDVELNSLYMSGTPHYLKLANHFDYFAFIFISILLFWQISILWRMFIKTLPRKSELP